jgi:protein TonB
MGQLSIASSANPAAAQKQKAAVVVAVLLGHISTLWLLAHMKPIELRPIQPPKPVQVRFVKIVEPKPDLPKPKEPEKPKEPPKPQKVKIVDKPRALPPKIQPKVQQVKVSETKPVTKEPEVDSKVISTVVTTETVVQKTAEVTPVKAETSRPSDSSPREVSYGEISWRNRPRPNIQKTDLNRASSSTVVVRINADVQGKITTVRLVKSSGNMKIDNEVLRAVRSARFNPYIVDGVGVPVYADLPILIH